MANDAAHDLQSLQGSTHSIPWWQHARDYLRSGRYNLALASYRKLVQQFPLVPMLRAEMGLAFAGELEFAQADQAFQRALQLAPGQADLLIGIGLQYCQMRRMDQACACFERAVAASPSSFQARRLLATYLEKNSRLDEAWETIETYLARNPKDGQAVYFKAFLLHRKGLNNEAETALRNLLENDPAPAVDLQADACHLLGVILDGFGQYVEALSFFEKSKALKRQTMDTTALESGYEKMVGARRALMAELTPETLRRWREESAASPCVHSLALLAGAARSGTTLIEQILGAHPEIVVGDELTCFVKEIFGPLHKLPSWLTLNSLDGLEATRRAQFAGRYFKSFLQETGQPPGARLLLDKNPYATAWLPFWLRFFPQSKVIIALRDPRDVVISLYFRNIPAGDLAMVSHISLERTARDYSECMDVWLRMRELGGFDWIETRYEDVVGNLESEGRRLMNFLGLPWHQAQANYYEAARGKFVHSPTYHEVRQPVYKRAMQRWKHYAEALAPLQERLEPYLRAFGY
jgi:tetratricopeptide (TPR) repeat protein